MLRYAALLLVLLAGCNRDISAVHDGQQSKDGKPLVREYIEAFHWTHRDLSRYLALNGINVKMEENPDPMADASKGVVMNFHDGEDTVAVHLMPEPREAYSLAERWGDDSFQWGRFCFINTPLGTPRLFSRICEVLTRARNASTPSGWLKDGPATERKTTPIP